MGQIIQIGGQEPPDPISRPSRVRGRRALVLGGGGIAGASYEVGALLALNDVLSGFRANDFDIFVGTSAGAFLSACLANGITPEDFARSQITIPPAHVPSIRPQEIFKRAPRRLRRGAAAWAGGITGTARHVARRRAQTSMMDVVFSLADDFKYSLYTTTGIQGYLQKLFAMELRSDEFHELSKELYITATDLDTGERVVFGQEACPKAKISEAVAASAAIPVFYEPVPLHGREYLDGGLRSPINLDVALAAGADFIVVINPLTPYLHDPRYLMRGFDSPIRHLSQGGMGRLIAQVLRIMANSQLQKELDLMRVKHPEVDVLLIEPTPDDESLFVFNLMDYGPREQMSKAAFEEVAVELVTHFPEVKRMFQRHGITVSRKNLLAQLELVLGGGTALALLDAHDEASA